jgi:hypothetical protein
MSRCDSGNRVEVADNDDVILIRQTHDPDGPILSFTRAEWNTYIADVEVLGAA